MITGTPLLAGFYSVNGLPIQASYLNGLISWETNEEALANIPLGVRHPFMLLVVNGELCFFSENMLSIITLKSIFAQDASQIPVIDEEAVFTSENVEDVLYELYLAIQQIRSNYKILLPAGASLTERLAGTYSAPDGWNLASVGPTGETLEVLHSMSKRIVSITVKASDETGDRILVPFRDAYSGILENDNVINIEGLASGTTLPLIIELIFN